MMQTASRRKFIVGLFLYLACSLISFNVQSQAPNWDSVYADYFIKYAVSDTPAWVFPICFKNNFGDWDTVYIGHDNDATPWLDPAFGEGFVKFNTSQFNATLGFQADSGFKVWVLNLNAPNNFSIKFTNGIMPLTMYWNDELFYSDNLPFPDLSPFPNARIDLWCSDGNPFYNNCPINFPLNLSDSSFIGGTWLRIDSIYFGGNGTTDQPGTLGLEVVPFDKDLTSIEEKASIPEFEIYPNPAKDHLWVHSESLIPFHYTIYNLLGENVVNAAVAATEEIKIDLRGLHSGIYFVQIITEKSSLTSKIILP